MTGASGVGWLGLFLAACTGTSPHEAARPPLPQLLAAAPAPPADPPAVLGASAISGYLSEGQSRPQSRTFDIDLESLPVATWAEPSERAGFWLAPRGDGYQFFLRRPIFAEIVMDGLAFATFTGVSFGSGEPPKCGRGQKGVVAARWSGFAPKGWTDDGVDVELAKADYHLATCTATPRLVARARAHAIVPGFAYALRLKLDASGEDEDEDERLLVFLPSSQRMATTGYPGLPLDEANTGPFTRLSLPLSPGGAASAAARVSPAALRMWRGLRILKQPYAAVDESSPSEDLLVSLDIAWQSGKKTALLSLAMPRGADAKAYRDVIPN